MSNKWKVLAKDRKILRELAHKQLEIANSPLNQKRRKLWYEHNNFKGKRPMVLIETGGVRDPFLPELKCQEDWARNLERSFYFNIYQFEKIKDDKIIDPYLTVNWQVQISGYGVEVKVDRTDVQGGTFHYDPPLKDIERDFKKLKQRTFTVNREATLEWKEHLEDLFYDVLPVKIRGGFWWTMGLTWEAIKLIGLEELMLYMYDKPKALHRLMAFLKDDHLNLAKKIEEEGLLSLNNNNDYIGSGSYGFTDKLPKREKKQTDKVLLKDLWVLLESQETVGISPDMFSQFIFPYQQEIGKEFGLVYYGCCEPVNNRWHHIKKLSNLKSVSVSPWCDQEYMAKEVKRDYIYSRKPNPSLLSTNNFAEDVIREDIANTIKIAKDCELEIIMKDLHTVNNQVERMARWVEIVREEIAKVYGEG